MVYRSFWHGFVWRRFTARNKPFHFACHSLINRPAWPKDGKEGTFKSYKTNYLQCHRSQFPIPKHRDNLWIDIIFTLEPIFLFCSSGLKHSAIIAGKKKILMKKTKKKYINGAERPTRIMAHTPTHSPMRRGGCRTLALLVFRFSGFLAKHSSANIHNANC